ncbi:NAD(P)H:quinone oxidoreductase [Rhodopila sp.]|jgi:NAD(P)H dehydrogenase (quinone)|uniref:NAD(P)H:quinone oxidoreductase n=1 Tax=Rhodopila sp. TaxID=2480087 RepID=UPI002B90C961|nr:NAD(P)H:quinone oxidoreductase [Rhodopila sp.]HVZ06635.1 NAD(P)H:quinone oxidoreductase [Rhodopila sp.]
MARVLVLYYSSYGHIEMMAQAVAQGAIAGGATVDIKRMPETVPVKLVESAGFRVNPDHPEADPKELTDYDAIVVGTPVNYGNIAAQVSSFWARTTGLWKDGALVGKLAGAFSSTGSQHGGNEAALLSMHKVFLHHGMIVIGLPYTYHAQLDDDRVAGGSPYGATTIAGKTLSLQPNEVELGGARFQGEHIAKVAGKVFG